jgi:uncharacterized protein (DUF2236 family)
MAPATYFTDDSLLRRVHREKVVALSGPRALLMMAAHPVAFEGFFMATGSLDDPYTRLQRTAQVMDAIAWRDRVEADRLTRRVRAMHARARGVLPRDAGRFAAGTPWAADDPELLLWIVACLVDSRGPSATPTGPTTASSAGSSACATATCPPRTRSSRPT